MTRTEESSVATSLQLLLIQEEERRAEQVILAHRRKQEQERLHAEAQAQRAEAARNRAEAAAREVSEHTERERDEAARNERERALVLERARGDIELQTKLTLMKTEQQHEMERLALQRDGRVRALEGQRGMLVAALGTVTLGVVLLYVALLSPESRRQAVALTELDQRLGELRRRATEELHSRDRRVSELTRTLAERDGMLDKLRQDLKAAGEQRKTKPTVGRAPIERVDPRPAPLCPCDKTDPLCDCW